MIRFTWLQFRVQAWVGLAALAAAALVLAVTGPHLARLYDISALAACGRHGDCGSLTDNYNVLYKAGHVALYAVPALIGMFWGAPLLTRELETGTFRLAWTQTVTRGRWLAAKLGLIGLAAMVTAGLLSLMVTWWASPIERVSMNRLTPPDFAASGIAPIGYGLFAFVLGVTAGVLIRRTVPAIAVTLVVFAAVQLAMPQLVRPHLIAPVHATSALNADSAGLSMTIRQSGPMTVVGPVSRPGTWVLSNQTIDPAGHLFTGPATQACLTGSARACTTWLTSKHLRQVVTYQPASRYWAFQWYETAIFVALALLLAGFCSWWIRRRLA